MNIVADILIVLIIAVFTLAGWKRGFIKTLPGFINVIASLVVAASLCSFVGAIWPLHESELIAKIIAFIIVFVIMLFVMKLLRFTLDKICEKTFFKVPNKVLGIIIGLILGVFYAWTFSTLIGALLPVLVKYLPDLFTSDLVENSFILKLFYNFNPLTLINLFK